MKYLDRLRESSSALCLGLDPVESRLPKCCGGGVDGVDDFLTQLLGSAQNRGLLPSTLKPNLAYFEQFGWRGWRLLQELVERWSPHCVIILDAKRGDIGRSSVAYAHAMFKELKGDAVTLHPWMGPDSVAPFVDYFPAQGGYLLLRTSNPGGGVLQSGQWQGLFQSIESWDPGGNLGFVVGATRPDELAWVLEELHPGRPLLIPGVGTQGGSAAQTVRLIRESRDPRIHRVNVSSAILYAHEAEGACFPESNLDALEEYSQELDLGA